MSPRCSTKRNSSTRGGAVCPQQRQQPTRRRSCASTRPRTPATRTSSQRPSTTSSTPDAAIRTPLPIDATGAEKLKQVWSMLFSVYPDIHLTVDDLIAARRQDRRQEHASPVPTAGSSWARRPPANRVTYNEIFIFRFVEGRSPRPGAWSTSSRRCGSSGWSASEELADRARRRLRLIDHDEHVGVVDDSQLPLG